MCTLTQNFGLSFGHNKKLLAVFSFFNQASTKFHGFYLKFLSQTIYNVFVYMRKQRNTTKRLYAKRRNALQKFHFYALGSFQFHLCAVYTVSARVHLRPWEQLKKQTWSDRPHLRSRLSRGCQLSGCSSGYTAL